MVESGKLSQMLEKNEYNAISTEKGMPSFRLKLNLPHRRKITIRILLC